MISSSVPLRLKGRYAVEAVFVIVNATKLVRLETKSLLELPFVVPVGDAKFSVGVMYLHMLLH